MLEIKVLKIIIYIFNYIYGKRYGDTNKDKNENKLKYIYYLIKRSCFNNLIKDNCRKRRTPGAATGWDWSNIVAFSASPAVAESTVDCWRILTRFVELLLRFIPSLSVVVWISDLRYL